MQKKIQSALISVFYKDGLEPIAKELQGLGITIYSTGGTQKFIEDLGVECVGVEKTYNISFYFRWTSENASPCRVWRYFGKTQQSTGFEGNERI